MDRRLLREETPPLSPDQRAVLSAYFDSPGVVCAPAGSGTGKTTTAVETVAEAVVRELHDDPERNPFRSVLVTTFTTDAARQLKTALKARLREHRRAAPPDDPVVRRWSDVVRWLEAESDVSTIDSFTQDLLREVALDAGVAPAFGVADGVRRSDLLESVFGTLRESPSLSGPVERLDATFPPARRREGEGDGDTDTPEAVPDWEATVAAVHRNCRQSCIPIDRARRRLLQSVTAMHAGREPDSFGDVLAIVDELTDFDPDFFARNVTDPDAWVAYARDTYRTSRRLAGDFGVVLDAFDREYDDLSRSQGALTHTDITHLVRGYLEGELTDEDEARRRRFRAGLAGRFRHVVVDEFQDTNYAQCRILAHLLEDARALLIGDLKQSIYEWRSAEPRLFAELIGDGGDRGDGGDGDGVDDEDADGRGRSRASGADRDASRGTGGDAIDDDSRRETESGPTDRRESTADNVLDAPRVRTVPLTENFRSHPHLVRVANHLFPRVFDDPARGGIGTFDVDYEALTPRRRETESDRAHVHALRIDGTDDEDDDRSARERRVEAEAERVAGVLRAALDDGTMRIDRDGTGDEDGGDGDDASDAGAVSEADDGDDAGDGDGDPGESDGGDGEDLDPVRPGDVAVLARSRRYLRLYSRVLDRYGIDNAVIGSHSLFSEPEVDCLVDALAWIDRPGDPELTRRVAGSPVSGLSGPGVTRLGDHDWDLDRAIAGWDGSPADLEELESLRSLREDLAPRRDGSKARLVDELLARTAFDVAAMADREGLQRYANLRRVVTVVDGWEDDDPIPYGEFLRRLDRLRSGQVDDDTGLAAVADADSPGTVKLSTVHAAKGLEFPVVVLADPTDDERYRKACDESFVVDRRHGVALRPAAGDADQPADGGVPTFGGDWFQEGDSGYDFDRGLLWLSERRGDDGRIRHDHPFEGYVRDRRAEFWRLLYVAVTRAGDHLLLPFPENRRGGEWTTWAGALAEYLDLDPDAVVETSDGPVPVGVDDLPAADPPARVDLSVERLLAPDSGDDAGPGGGDRRSGDADRESDRDSRGGGGDPAADPDRRFVPASPAATQVRPLLADPEAFQRAVLWGLGRATSAHQEDPWTGATDDPFGTGAADGGDSDGPDDPADPDDGVAGTAGDGHTENHDPGGGPPADAAEREPPGSIRPDDWGDAVHRTVEVVNAAPGPDAVDDRRVARRAVAETVGDHPDAGDARERIRTAVLPAYRRTDTWRDLAGDRGAGSGAGGETDDESGGAADAHESTDATDADPAGSWLASPVLPEHRTAAPLPASALEDGPAGTAVLRGRIDLLYRRDGWRIVDFKTGRPAAAGSDRHETYRTQLDAYAWLVRATAGVVPRARLAYLPAGVERAVDADPDRFAQRLDRLGDLYVDRAGRLRRSE